jgi:hypothetical protein
VGLLTDAAGFPLMVNAFEANKAETTTMLPTIKAYMAAHRLSDVVIVADAGMISEKNMKAIEAAGLSFILGMKIPDVPYVISEWQRKHPGEPVPDGHVFVQPWPAGSTEKRRDQVRYYQYKHDRARRTLNGIDEQVHNAEQAVAGKTAVKRNRFVTLSNATKTVNRELEAKARALAGIKGFVTNIANPTPEQVIGAYHQLFQIEKSFRMAKSDLAARSTTAPKTRSRRTSRSCSPPWPSPAGSRTPPGGRSGNSSSPSAATAPSTSRPANTSSQQPTHYPTTSIRSSKRSRPEPPRTNLAQRGSLQLIIRSVPVPACSSWRTWRN